MIERSVYNRRVRRLRFKLEEIRQKMIDEMTPNTDLYIVDSMPLEVCKFTRANRSKVCQENKESASDFCFCAAQNFHYFGYKLHVVCTPDGIIKMYDITKASNHDIHFLNDIQSQLDNCVLVGDKSYLSQQWQHDLFSQLCDQFMTQRNYAKSLAGISRRVVTNIATLTLIQWVNQLAGNKLNNLKIVIS